MTRPGTPTTLSAGAPVAEPRAASLRNGRTTLRAIQAELRVSDGELRFTYDAAGRRDASPHRYGHGPLPELGCERPPHRPSLTTPGAPGQRNLLLQHRAYAYRADGYVTEVRELTSGTRRYDLDVMGRVTGVRGHGWTETYAYDASGNLAHASAPAHDAAGDQEIPKPFLVRRSGRTSYEYDAQGRLVRETRKLLNGQQRIWTLAWNAEGPSHRGNDTGGRALALRIRSARSPHVQVPSPRGWFRDRSHSLHLGRHPTRRTAGP